VGERIEKEEKGKKNNGKKESRERVSIGEMIKP
jgi:hypothetical protein